MYDGRDIYRWDTMNIVETGGGKWFNAALPLLMLKKCLLFNKEDAETTNLGAHEHLLWGKHPDMANPWGKRSEHDLQMVGLPYLCYHQDLLVGTQRYGYRFFWPRDGRVILMFDIPNGNSQRNDKSNISISWMKENYQPNISSTNRICHGKMIDQWAFALGYCDI